MDDETWQPQQFERHRAHLQAVAYQEAWLRLSRADGDAIANIGGWLTTVVGRVCIDMLRARNSRREDYVGTWMPEPVVSVDDGADPEKETLLADAVGLALLVVLETLTPSERLAFVLHDMFAVPFDEIAPMVDRTPSATRQLASRARRRVRGAAPAPDADLAKQREVVAAYLAASRAGVFDSLVAVLDPDVVFRADTGSRPNLAPAQLTGAAEVARYAVARGSRFAPFCRPALVIGAAGLIAQTPAGPLAVVGFTVTHGRITTIDLIIDPDKLRTLVPAS